MITIQKITNADELYTILVQNKTSVEHYISLGNITKEHLLSNTVDTNLYLGIFVNEELCGQIRLEKETRRTVPGTKGLVLNLAYWVAASHRGQGVATEALRILLEREVFTKWQAREISEIFADIKADNSASQHVVSRNGFTLSNPVMPWRSVQEAVTVAGSTCVPTYKQIWIWQPNQRNQPVIPRIERPTAFTDCQEGSSVEEFLELEKAIEHLSQELLASANLPPAHKSPIIATGALHGLFIVDDDTTKGAIVAHGAVVFGPIQALVRDQGATYFQDCKLDRVDANEAHFNTEDVTVIWKKVAEPTWTSDVSPELQGIWRRPIGNFAAVFNDSVIVSDKQVLKSARGQVMFRGWVTSELRGNIVVWTQSKGTQQMVWSRQQKRTIKWQTMEIARRNLEILRLAEDLYIDKCIDSVAAETSMRSLFNEIQNILRFR